MNQAKASKSISDFVPKKLNKDSKFKKDETKDGKVSYEVEDSAELARSRKMLEKKAKYYDKMMKAGGSVDNDNQYLILFNRKREEENSFENQAFEDQHYSDRDDDEEWVDYTDCLGRTRKCLKSDLNKMQEKDSDLHKIVLERQKGLEDNQPVIPEVPHTETAEEEEDDNNYGPSPSLIQKPIQSENIGDRFREQRAQWEKRLEEHTKKEFVHYQDVLFDEARDHGVGFYQFSTDEEERKKQQKELERLHKETVAAQKQKEDLKTARDRLIADRVKAAKARQRARLGLPPEEESDEKEIKEKLELENEEEKQKAMEEEIKKQREIEEQIRATARKKHIRPWDANKSGTSTSKNQSEDDDEEWRPRYERFVLTQDEWNEKQREIREPEFAPPSSFDSKSGRDKKRDKRNRNFEAVPPPVDQYNFPPPPIPSSFNIPPPVTEPDDSFFEDRKGGLFFSSKKPTMKRRNQSDVTSGPVFTQTPIQNEISSDGEEQEIRQVPAEKISRKKTEMRGAEVPPPTSWDYYTPENTKRFKVGSGSSRSALEESIEQGLKFLREQSDKAGPTTKNKWATNADY